MRQENYAGDATRKCKVCTVLRKGSGTHTHGGRELLRFVIRTVNRDTGHVSKFIGTLDAACPELEATLKRGGRGGGPDGDDFEYREVIGVEVLAPDKAEKV
jgi:hypothetical protein